MLFDLWASSKKVLKLIFRCWKFNLNNRIIVDELLYPSVSCQMVRPEAEYLCFPNVRLLAPPPPPSLLSPRLLIGQKG